MNRTLLMLSLLTMIGCNNVTPPIEARQDPYGAKQIMIAEEDLRKHTAVDRPILSRDSADILYVEVPIRSASNLRLHVDYRISFFDEKGHRISQSGWMTKVLEPNIPDQITANSMSPRAKDFQLDLRYAQ